MATKGGLLSTHSRPSESSKAALDLANQHLGERPVTGVLITHSHADHFAGILGVVSHEQAASGEVPVIAPQHFVQGSPQ